MLWKNRAAVHQGVTQSMDSMEHIDFEEYLSRYGSLTYKNKGFSMMPLLRQDRDLFTIEKKGAERCRKYDVVLYKDCRGKYILHRIIKVLPDGYVIRGDNNYFTEFKTDGEILGVMTGFRRDGKDYKVTDFSYKAYSVLRCASYPLRSVYVKLRHAAGKVMKPVLYKNNKQ